MQSQDPTLPAILPLGVDALVVRFSLEPDLNANAAARVFARDLAAGNCEGIDEIVPSLASLMVRFDPARIRRSALVARLRALLARRDWAAISAPAPSRRWVLPAAFGGVYGPQLEEAAGLAGISPAQALDELRNARLSVLAIGFAPGQPFLGLLGEHWDFPRMAELTERVPAGALVVALRQIVLFANASPTGWRHIGRTTFRPFRPEAREAFPLRVGDEVVFDVLDHSAFGELLASGAEAGAKARLEFLA